MFFIESSKPTQNGQIESFNGKFLDECLNLEWFTCLPETRVLIESWRTHYNQIRLDAWQWFDLVREAGTESFEDAFAHCRGQKFLVFSIDSDLAFRPEEQGKLVDYLHAADVDALWMTVHSDKGHDSFLLEPRLYTPHLHALWDGE